MSTELHGMTVSQLAPKVKSRKISPVDLTRAVLEQIEILDPMINAYITVDAEGALKAARTAQRQIAKGKYLGPLHGIPISLKDLYDTKGMLTTAGSKIMGDRIPAEDATSRRPAACSRGDHRRERRTSTNSPSAAPLRIRISAAPEIPTIRTAFPAARAGVRRPPLPPTCASLRRAAIRAARSAPLPPCAGSWGSNRPTDASASAGSFLSPRPSTTWAQ